MVFANSACKEGIHCEILPVQVDIDRLLQHIVNLCPVLLCEVIVKPFQQRDVGIVVIDTLQQKI